MDDSGMNHSFGQPFMTMGGQQCFCGDGGTITCDQSESSAST